MSTTATETRDYALPTYPGGGVRVTVDAALKQPRVILRAITALARDRFVSDQIFAKGTADQVAGGAAIFSRSESKYMDRDPEQVTPRARFPRAGWTTDLFAAAVAKYGLEVPISDESKRRNAYDELVRAQLRLANSLTKFVDGLAMSLFLNDPDVQTTTASADWSTAGTDIIADIVRAQNLITVLDEGYEPDTLICNPAQAMDLMNDADIRNAFPRETNSSPFFTGRPMPMLGLRQILPTNRLAAGTLIFVAAGIVGTIADEAPDPDEGYMANSPGPGFSPVYLKKYRHEDVDETILRVARFPAMWLSEPKAAVVMTGA